MPSSPQHTPTALGALPPPAAVLWDMDGTLVDTEPLWMAAETELVTSWGGTWTHEDGLGLVGNPMVASAAILRDRGIDLTLAEIIAFLNGRVAEAVAERTPWQPGARELLTALHRQGVPQALVTSSYRELADPFARVAGVFDAVVPGDEVRHAKPHAEPYLTAADQLRIDIGACVVVEDSPAGIGSGVASGARVLAVEVFTPVPKVDGLSVTDSLTRVSVDDLARLVAGETLDLRR